MIGQAKLSVPFGEACLLNERQKKRLIKLQARRISIPEWEITSLIEICGKKGWMDKGLAVLYEYAGCIDDFKTTSERRVDAVDYLLASLESLKNPKAAQFALESIQRPSEDRRIINEDEIHRTPDIGTLAYSVVSLTNRAISTLCSWRKLQWSPRPILFAQMGKKLSFQSVLEEEARVLYYAMTNEDMKVSVFDIVAVEYMAVLLAPALGFKEFLSLYQHMASKPDLIRPIIPLVERYSIQQLSSSDSQVRAVYLAMGEFAALEKRIIDTWNALHAALGTNGSGKSGEPIDPYVLYPTLRLPYRNYKPPTQDLDWFRDALPAYEQVHNALQENIGLSQVGSFVDDGGGADASVFAGRSTSPTSSPLHSPGTLGTKKSALKLEATAPFILSPVQDPLSSGDLRVDSRSPDADDLGRDLAFSTTLVGAAGPALIRSNEKGRVSSSTSGAQKKPSKTKRQDAEQDTAAADGCSYGERNETFHGARVDKKIVQQNGGNAGTLDLMSSSPLQIGLVIQNHVMHHYPDPSYLAARSPSFASEQPPRNANAAESDQRKRSVTIAVVGRPQQSGLAWAGEEAKRRITVAGPAMRDRPKSESKILKQVLTESISNDPVPAEATSAQSSTKSARPQSAKLSKEQRSRPSSPALVLGSQADLANSLVAETLSPAPAQTLAVATKQKSPEQSPTQVHKNPNELDTPSPTATAVEITTSISHRSSPSTSQSAKSQSRAKRPRSRSDQLSKQSPEKSGSVDSYDPVSVHSESLDAMPSQGSVTPQDSQLSVRQGGSLDEEKTAMLTAAADSPLKPSQWLTASPRDSGATLQSGTKSSFSDDRASNHWSPSSHQQQQYQQQFHHQGIHRAASDDVRHHRHRATSDDVRHHRGWHVSDPYSTNSLLDGSAEDGGIYQASPLMSTRKVISTDQQTASAPMNFADGHSRRNNNPTGKVSSASTNIRLWSAPASQQHHNHSLNRHRTSSSSLARHHRSSDIDIEVSDGLETLSMLDVLGRPFNRGPVLAESQVVHFALQHLRVEDGAVERLAARKITLWWQLVAPRKLLLRRISLKVFISTVITGLIDNVVVQGEIRRRRRHRLMRNGAAIKIQRYYRHWSVTVLAEEHRLEREERSRAAWERLELWSRCIIAALRIYRYVRWARRRKLIKKGKKEEYQLTRTKAIAEYFQLFALSKKLERQQQLFYSMSTKDPSALINPKRNKMHKERADAAVTMQKYYRRLHARNTVKKRRYFNAMNSKITYFFISCIAKRRVRAKKILNSAVTRIQRQFRGTKARMQVLSIVSSGLRLNAMWRRHVAYKSLKSQLRRVDRPHTIVLRGLRNISKKTVNSDTISFKVSVWWHPLLHIVSQNDFNVIIQSKQPQFIYKSTAYSIEEEGDSRGGRRLSISQSLRKLSTMLSHQSDRHKTYQEYVEAQQQRAVGLLDSSHSSSTLGTPHMIAGRQLSHRGMAQKSGYKLVLPPIAGGGGGSDGGGSGLLGATMFSPQENITMVEEVDEDCDEDTDDDHSPLPNGSSKGVGNASKQRSDHRNLKKSPHSRSYNGTPLRPGTRLEDEEDDNCQSPGRHNYNITNATAPSPGNVAAEDSIASSSHSHTRSKDSVVLNALALVPPHAEIYKKKSSQSSIRHKLSMFSNSSFKSAAAPSNQHKLYASFDDDVVKIPGCHGNSVIKFDILEGDRKYGNCLFYLSKGGEMMYWGGEYSMPVGLLQQRRAVQFNSHTINLAQSVDSNANSNANARKINPAAANSDEPILDFRIIAGAPMRSKCSWGRMIARGNGPLKRALQGRDIISAFLFDKWRRFYFSLDEFGLFMFDNKFNTEAFYCIHSKDLRKVTVEPGAHIQNTMSGTKAIVEDLHNVILTTYSGDILYMRFQDSGTRVSWHEVLSNQIAYQKELRPSRSASSKQRAWLRQSMAPKRRDANSSHLMSSSHSSGAEDDVESADSQVL